MNHLLLENHLEPLQPFLNQADISEISINKPGEVWIEQRGAMTRYLVPELTLRHLKDLAKLIATYSEQSISEEHPLLAANLPQGFRIQIVYPPAVLDQVVGISIRKASLIAEDLDWFNNQNSSSVAKVQDREALYHELSALHSAGNYKDLLALAIKARCNILISGGTSSGKTTFLNSLLKQIPATQRIITIEDVPEIQLTQPNSLSMFASRSAHSRAQIDMQDLVEASLRLRPDRIIIGELRGAEAFSFLRAINTGHPGSMATIHADSPTLALEQLILMVMQKNLGLKRDEIENYARLIIDLVVQLKKGSNGSRHIAEIYLNFKL